MATTEGSRHVALTLYRSLFRLSREYRNARIPLVGVSPLGYDSFAWMKTPKELHEATLQQGEVVKNLFHSTRSQTDINAALDGGFAVLRTLRKQLRVLEGASEEAREALAAWSSLLEATRSQMRGLPEGAARGRAGVESVERAALQLCALSRPPAPLWEDDAGGSRGDAEADEEARAASAELDRIALAVRESFPDRFPGAGACPDGSEAARKSQLEAISEVLFTRERFRSLPVEWVYDGLDPLLLTRVLEKRNAVPIAVAILYQAVASRLGVPSALCQATWHHVDASLSISGAASLPPDPEVWLLCVPTAGGGALAVEPGRKGRLLSAERRAELFPMARPRTSTTLADAVSLWAALARTAVIARQRRGESEEVADWLYQLLALDPEAPEWEFMLSHEGGLREADP